MALTKQEIQEMMDAAARRAIEETGLVSATISEREAGARYGAWFKAAVKEGRIAPAKVTGKKRAFRHYQVSDILAQQAADRQLARLQLQSQQII